MYLAKTFIASTLMVLGIFTFADAFAHPFNRTFDLGESKIRLVDGSSLTGSIESIAGNGAVVGQNLPAELNLRDVIGVETSRTIAGDMQTPSILMIGGGVIPVAKATVGEEWVRFESTAGLSELSLQSVRAIVWKETKTVAKTITTPLTANDQVLVQTDDGERIVEGILESVDATHVHVNYKGESRKIGLDRVTAVVMADLGLPKLNGSIATVRLTGGAKILGVIAGLDGGELELAIAGSDPISLRSSLIADISIVSDRLVFLSDLEPLEVEEKSLFAIHRTWQRDLSVQRNGLSIRHSDFKNVTQFKKGIGTQAYSRLVFENTRAFDTFAATVGIDAETDGRGDCRLVVLGDGIELWSKRVQAADGPETIELAIQGMKQITLQAYPGEQFDLGDHADWGNARFLKTE